MLNLKSKTEAQLRYIIKDASEARDNMSALGNEVAYSKYADQVCDCASELYRRKQTKSGTISAQIIAALKANGNDVAKALDSVIGAGTFAKLAGDVYDELNAKS